MLCYSKYRRASRFSFCSLSAKDDVVRFHNVVSGNIGCVRAVVQWRLAYLFALKISSSSWLFQGAVGNSFSVCIDNKAVSRAEGYDYHLL